MSGLRGIATEYRDAWDALAAAESHPVHDAYDQAHARWVVALEAYQGIPDAWSKRAAFDLDALDNERRQTQRRMIAALYWRAGDAEVIGRAYHRAGGRGSMVTARSWLEASSALAHAAQVMEAACPR